MHKSVRKILVIRLHHEMAYALSTQNISIIAFNFENTSIILNPENIESNLKLLPRTFPNQTIFDGLRNAFLLTKLVNVENPDIVHVNALQDLFFAFIAVQINRFYGYKPQIVAMSRNPLSWNDSTKSRIMAKLIQFFSDGFICLSNTHKEQLLRLGFPSDRLSFIPNPFSLQQLKQINALSDELSSNRQRKTRIIYVAHICERKAQDVLINAASYVIKKHPDVIFELIGRVIPGEEAYAEKLHSLISELNITEFIRFVGEVPYSEVINSLKNSDIVVFPTQSEMMPRAVIEAMSAGKPVISSAVDGILDLIKNRETGILLQPGNIEELSNSICELIDNPSLANKLGLAGQEYITEFCSPVRVGGLFRQFYEYLLDKS